MRRLAAFALVALAGVSLLACAADRLPASDDYVAPKTVLSGVDGGKVPDDPEPSDDAGQAAEPDAGSSTSDAAAEASLPDAAIEAAPVYDPDAICPSSFSIGTGALLPISTSADDVGLSVTADGLSAAWTTADGDEVTIHYVDRSATGAPFGAERRVTGTFGSRRVALRSDGLGLAAVNADGLGFSYLERADRADAFGAPSVDPFEQLAAQGAEELRPAGERFDNPVFARLDMFLLYTRVGATSSRTFVSTRFSLSAPFAGGAPFAEEALGGRRVVTGVSEDVRSLFVWDEQQAKSRLVTLNASSLVVGDVELGAMRDVQPSADCRSFWFGRDGDLFRYSLP